MHIAQYYVATSLTFDQQQIYDITEHRNFFYRQIRALYSLASFGDLVSLQMHD